MRKLILSSVAVVVIGCFALGGWLLAPHRILDVSSPDAGYQLTVTKRVTFPPSELFDPSVELVVIVTRLTPTGTESELLRSEQRFVVLEDSDVGALEARWGEQSVSLAGVKNLLVEVELPRETGGST